MNTFSIGDKAFPIAENLGQYKRVKLTTTLQNGVPIVTVAGLTDSGIGVITRSAFTKTGPVGQTLNDVVDVHLSSCAGTTPMIINGACSVGDTLYSAALGFVSATQGVGSYVCGTALNAATASGDVVEVLPTKQFMPSANEMTYGSLLSGGVDQATHAVSATQNYALGTKRVSSAGEVYHYAHAEGAVHCGFGAYNAGGVTISGAAPAQTQTGLGAIGYSTVTVTIGASAGYGGNGAIALNELAGGNIIINNGGGGELLVMNRRIIGNTAVAAGGGTTVVTLDSPLTVACTVSTSYIEILENPYAHIIGGLTTPTDGKSTFMGVPAGVATATLHYFWLQTHGIVWICPNSDPGLNAYDREVYFQNNGTIIGGEDATIETGIQRAGYIVEKTTAGAGPPMVMLQLE